MAETTGKYIIWVADSKDYEVHGTVRTRDGRDSCTDILEENLDCSGRPIPEPGDRTIAYKIDGGGQRWSRLGDWVAARVESYPADIPGYQKFSEVVICLCEYDPIEPDWKPMGKAIVSVDSFGGDADAFNEWLSSDEAKSGNYQVVEPGAKPVRT